MVKFLQTLFGLLFFGFSLFILIIKNHPKDYLISIEQEMAYPLQSHIDYLSSQQGNEFWQKNFKKDYTGLDKVFFEKQIQLLPKKLPSIEYIIPTSKGFNILEKWSFDQRRNTVKLSYTYSVNFVEKLYLFFNSTFFSRIKSLVESRLATSLLAIKQQFTQHRWEYLGEQSQAFTYYITIEGSSDWSMLSNDLAVAQKGLIVFAKEKKLTTLEDPFVFYPSIRAQNVYWRAALKTDRYYNTNSDIIKCLRYEGGNSIALTHFGDLTYLKESWLILKDSLKTKLQSYSAIQIEKINKEDTRNPLKWETVLIIPIQ